MRVYFPPRRARGWKGLGLLTVVLLFFLFRGVLFQGLGGYLVVEDPKEQVDALFILSGDAVSRAPEGARLYREGLTPIIYCLGGEKSPILEAYGIEDLSCEFTRTVLKKEGVDSSAVRMLCEGTSTFEEFEAIRRECKSQGFHKVMVVSSKFHTRRIDTHFRQVMKEAGVDMVLRGAPAVTFSEEQWWKSEEGLLFLNNEYIKNLYYWLKY